MFAIKNRNPAVFRKQADHGLALMNESDSETRYEDNMELEIWKILKELWIMPRVSLNSIAYRSGSMADEPSDVISSDRARICHQMGPIPFQTGFRSDYISQTPGMIRWRPVHPRSGYQPIYRRRTKGHHEVVMNSKRPPGMEFEPSNHPLSAIR